MDDAEQKDIGAFYRLAPDRSVICINKGYCVTNGPAFSPCGTRVYLTDSGRKTVYVATFDQHRARIVGKEIFLRFDGADGVPDGMTTDANGNLWIAFWDGWAVRAFSPSGERILEIEMPVSRPTSCTFAGKGSNTLYVTSASIGHTLTQRVAQPLAGGLFQICGLPTYGGLSHSFFG